MQRKTIIFEEWKGSLTDMINDGDIVDNDIVNYFINCLPPLMKRNNTSEAVQCSEPVDHGPLGPRFITFIRHNDKIREFDQKTPINNWLYYKTYSLNKVFN